MIWSRACLSLFWNYTKPQHGDGFTFTQLTKIPSPKNIQRMESPVWDFHKLLGSHPPVSLGKSLRHLPKPVSSRFIPQRMVQVLSNFKTYHVELFWSALALAAIAELCLIFPGLMVDLFKPGLGNLMKTDLRAFTCTLMGATVSVGLSSNESPQKRHTFKNCIIAKVFNIIRAHCPYLTTAKQIETLAGWCSWLSGDDRKGLRLLLSVFFGADSLVWLMQQGPYATTPFFCPGQR